MNDYDFHPTQYLSLWIAVDALFVGYFVLTIIWLLLSRYRNRYEVK